MGAPAEPTIARKMTYVGRVLHLCMTVAASFVTSTKSLQFECLTAKTVAACSLALNRSPFTPDIDPKLLVRSMSCASHMVDTSAYQSIRHCMICQCQSPSPIPVFISAPPPAAFMTTPQCSVPVPTPPPISTCVHFEPIV